MQGTAAGRRRGASSTSSTTKTTSSRSPRPTSDGLTPPPAERRAGRGARADERVAVAATFIEAGGALPATAADERCSKRSCASGDFLPSCCSRTSGALAAPGRGSLAAPRRSRPTSSRARSAPRRRRRPVSPGCSAVCGASGATSFCAWARASSAGGRPTRSRASCRVRRRLPGRRVSVCDAELRREFGEPKRRRWRARPLRGHGDGEAGRRGAELLVRRRRLLLLLDRRGRGRANARCTITTSSCRGGCQRRWSRRPATARCSGSTCACGRRGATARCAIRWRRPRLLRDLRRTWERQAWLRARPVAGDRALGDELLAMLEPFIYPRSIDPRMVDDVRALRAMFRDPADAAGALGETGFDVKLGAGGIRDVEMVVQALQLLHAGKRPDLRERNTPRAFPRLVVAGLLSDREAWTLLSAYRFWRRLEHRVQVATGAQTPPLPGDADARARFADGPGLRHAGGVRRRGAAQARGGRGDRGDAGRTAAPRCTLEAARLLDPLRDRAEVERLAARRRVSATPRPRPTRWRRWGRGCRPRCWSRRSRRPIRIARCCIFAS